MVHADRRSRSSRPRPPGDVIDPQLRGEHPSAARDASELVETPIDERQTTPGHHVPNGRRDQHLAGTRDAREARPEMDGNSTEPPVLEFALSRVHPGPDLEAEVDDVVVESTGEGDRDRGDLERREEAVSGRIHFPATERDKPGAESGVVIPQQIGPRAVTELNQAGGRIDDVGEQHRRQDAAREGLEVLEPPLLSARVLHR